MPPRTTVDTNPEDCRASARRRCWFVCGIDVNPNRAREAFWRCEQTLERCTSDILRWNLRD